MPKPFRQSTQRSHTLPGSITKPQTTKFGSTFRWGPLQRPSRSERRGVTESHRAQITPTPGAGHSRRRLCQPHFSSQSPACLLREVKDPVALSLRTTTGIPTGMSAKSIEARDPPTAVISGCPGPPTCDGVHSDPEDIPRGSLTFQAPSPHCLSSQNAWLLSNETETRTQAAWRKWARMSMSTCRYSAGKWPGSPHMDKTKNHAKVPTQFAAPLWHLHLMMFLSQPGQSMSRKRNSSEISPLTEASITRPHPSDQNHNVRVPWRAPLGRRQPQQTQDRRRV